MTLIDNPVGVAVVGVGVTVQQEAYNQHPTGK